MEGLYDLKPNQLEDAMEKIWILVADSAHARILATTALTASLTEIRRLEHPEGRLKESELVTDQPGRARESLAQGHAIQEGNATEHEATLFAGEIIQLLDKARQEGKFESLVLIAPPHFLGIIRQKLTGPLEKLVIQSVDKNLVSADESTIQKNIYK